MLLLSLRDDQADHSTLCNAKRFASKAKTSERYRRRKCPNCFDRHAYSPLSLSLPSLPLAFSLAFFFLLAFELVSRGRFFSRPQTPLELNSMSHARRGDRVGERKRPRDRGNSVRTTETLAAAAATRGLRLREELQIDFSLKIKRALLLRSLSLFRPLCAGQGGREPPSWRGLRTD